MNRIIAIAIEQRRITLFLTFVIAVYGLISYLDLPKQESPDVAIPIAMITTIYPGASPNTVEKLVTSPIEDAASEINGFESVRAYSRDSVSILGVRLHQGIDYEKSWQELRDRIDDVQSSLPRGCRTPTVKTDLSETAGMLISLSGENYSYDQLTSFAEVFKKALASVDGITRFEFSGVVEKRVEVTVEIEKLNQHGISLEDITKILQAQNIEIPSGKISMGNFKINVSTPGTFESLRDIENIIIDVSRTNGAPVRLRDIAHVKMDLDPNAFRIRQDGSRAVLLAGYFQPSKNVVSVGKEVRSILDDVKRSFPDDLIVTEVVYQPTDVAESVNGFMGSLLQGIALVIIVVFIGMGLRNAIIVSAVIPISVLITFATMSLLDVKVHQVSIAALIIALGMLVDNAIVVADAVQVRIDEGMEKARAALEGALESAVPILTSTLTTIAAFSPLLALPGMAGQFLEAIPIIVIVALSASFVVAMIVTPAIAAIFFEPLKSVTYKENPVRSAFRKMLNYGLSRPNQTLAFATALFMIALGLASLLKVAFFPYTDKSLVYIDVTSETLDLDATEEVIASLEKILRGQKEVNEITSSIGQGLPRFYITLPNSIQSHGFGQVLVKFDLDRTDNFSSNEDFAGHLQHIIDTHLLGGSATVKRLQQGEPVKAPVVVRLTGDDMDRLEQVATDLAAKIRELPGTINVSHDAPRKNFELKVDVDHDVANSMGISKYDIQRQISIALYGSPSSVFRKGGHEYDIIVQSDIDSKDKLYNFAVKSSIAGNKVLIRQFAEVALRSRLESIVHFQRERSVAVVTDIIPGVSSSSAIASRIEKEIIPTLDLSDVTVIFDGEREKIKKNFGNVGISALFALAAIYIILLLQFGSFRKPFIILVTVPLSIVGSIVGLLITFQPLSFTAFLGIASLIGIVVNNAILLIEFINTARASGMSLDQACRDAVAKRFRPISLSTVTTVMGLVPLAISGSAMFTPMAIALMTGLLGSTFLTMVVIPVTYRQLESLNPSKKTD